MSPEQSGTPEESVLPSDETSLPPMANPEREEIQRAVRAYHEDEIDQISRMVEGLSIDKLSDTETSMLGIDTELKQRLMSSDRREKAAAYLEWRSAIAEEKKSQ